MKPCECYSHLARYRFTLCQITSVVQGACFRPTGQNTEGHHGFATTATTPVKVLSKKEQPAASEAKN